MKDDPERRKTYSLLTESEFIGTDIFRSVKIRKRYRFPRPNLPDNHVCMEKVSRRVDYDKFSDWNMGTAHRYVAEIITGNKTFSTTLEIT